MTDPEYRARVAMLRKAPNSTHDPSGPTQSSRAVSKGTLGLCFISGFTRVCVSEPNNPFETVLHYRTLAGICICKGLGLELSPNKGVSQSRWAEKSTPALSEKVVHPSADVLDQLQIR